MNKKIINMSLSELAFIILTDNYYSNKKNDAYLEIKRRFSKNGCNYDAFIEYESEAISKRGDNIENYLIQANPNAQLLLQLYYNYVYQNEIFQHGNLLFSENLLCNSNSQRSFFTRALKVELNNLNKRLQVLSNSSDEYQMLLSIYNSLYDRYNKKQTIWYENSLTDCVMDIVTECSSLKSDKIRDKMEKYAKNWNNGSKIAMLQCILLSIPMNSEILDYLNMHRIANNDIFKLLHQQKSIMESLKKVDNIDYSFIKEKKLELKR